MKRTSDFEHVISQGTIRDGMSRVDYYTTLPSPNQWIAVGVVVISDREATCRRPRRMLVGTGRDEATAVDDLRRRFADLCRTMRKHRPEALVTAGVETRARERTCVRRARRIDWIDDSQGASEPHASQH